MTEPTHPSSDEFYVGYLPRAPLALGAWVRHRLAALLLVTTGLAALVIAVQGPFANSVFEFGNPRRFAGWVSTTPSPGLLVPHPDGRGVSRYLLVGTGKRGADASLAGFEGKQVQLEGTLVYRDDQTMIELTSAPIQELAAGLDPTFLPAGEDGPHPPQSWMRWEELGTRTLGGEIVDSKCFFGVMKPGSGKTHRACAARCISGGIPPVLAMREDDGGLSYVLLTAMDGTGIGHLILDHIAEPVEITGRLERQGELKVLRCDPSSIRRLTE